jgi:hypothetical protein
MVRNENGFNPLILAARCGQLDVVSAIVESSRLRDSSSTLVDATDDAGCTALHHACFDGHISVVRYLLFDAKADAKKLDFSGRTPLDLSQSAEAADLVRSAIASVDSEKTESQATAKANAIVPNAVVLSTTVSSPSTSSSSSSSSSSWSGSSSKVSESFDEFAMFRVVDKDSGKVFDIRTLEGIPSANIGPVGSNADAPSVDIGATTNDPSAAASGEALSDAVKMMLMSWCRDEGTDDGQVVLISQLNSLSASTVKTISTFVFEDGHTALQSACLHSRVDAVRRMLLQWGFDAKAAKADDGCTPLHLACWGGSLEIVQLLVGTANADMSAISKVRDL